MNRLKFIKLAGISTSAVLIGGLMGWKYNNSITEASQNIKSNFVVILTDDLGYGDIEPFGSKLNRTPNLDRMAEEGMKLTSFYAASVCTPSRAQLLTGCYAKRVSLPDVLFPAGHTGISSNEKTVADLLKAEGYSTMCIGKWHLGDQEEFLPTKHGFDHYVGIPYSNDMGGNDREINPNAREWNKVRPPLPLMYDNTVVEAPVEQTKLTELYTREAVKFIEKNKDKPFFLYLPHTAVHVPIYPGKNFQDKSANGRYGDWVEEVDWSVGQILEALKKINLDSRTLVLFTSDNGPWMSKGKDGGVAYPLRGAKGTNWEGGVRVPTIARWPGTISPGSICNAAASEMDLLPTFVKLAGGTVPSDRIIDGRDIFPLLSGVRKDSPHEALYYFFSNNLEAVRSGPWKLIIIRQNEGTEKSNKRDTVTPFTPELYNLDEDIGERNNVAAKYPDVVKKLMGYINKMDSDLGIQKIGPGVRPCGYIKNPKPILLN